MFGHHTTALLIVQLLQNLIKTEISIIDMYPTILAAMGVKIEWNKLGLGS